MRLDDVRRWNGFILTLKINILGGVQLQRLTLWNNAVNIISLIVFTPFFILLLFKEGSLCLGYLWGLNADEVTASRDESPPPRWEWPRPLTSPPVDPSADWSQTLTFGCVTDWNGWRPASHEVSGEPTRAERVYVSPAARFTIHHLQISSSRFNHSSTSEEKHLATARCFCIIWSRRFNVNWFRELIAKLELIELLIERRSMPEHVRLFCVYPTHGFWSIWHNLSAPFFCLWWYRPLLIFKVSPDAHENVPWLWLGRADEYVQTGGGLALRKHSAMIDGNAGRLVLSLISAGDSWKARWYWADNEFKERASLQTNHWIHYLAYTLTNCVFCERWGIS